MNNLNINSTMKCSQCGFPVLPKHSYCPNCGQLLKKASELPISPELHSSIEKCTTFFKHPHAARSYIQNLCNTIVNEVNSEYEASNILDDLEDLCRTDLVRSDKAQLADLADKLYDYILEAKRQRQETLNCPSENTNHVVQQDREEQLFNFDLEERLKDADETREVNRDIHRQEMADWDTNRSQDIVDRESLRSREGRQFDFDLEERRKDADETRVVNRDIHRQDMTDRDANRSQDIADRETLRGREGRQFDFDLEERRKDADETREVNRDIHRQDIMDRETKRDMEGLSYVIDLKRAEKAADLDICQQEKRFDFDLEVLKQERADEHILRMEAHEMKMNEHKQDMADREAQRRMEELKMKGNIAIQNMQAMLDAKRAARHDELKHEEDLKQSQLEAEERRLQAQKEMTAEQIMAAQIREMDAGAQTTFAESFSAGKNAEREREVAKEQAQIYEKMMGQMMDMAKTGMQVNADIATGRMTEQRKRADEYKEEAHRVQERLDRTQEQSLKYTTQVTSSIPTAQQKSSAEAIPLNTAWLREHGYDGSFNELARQFAKKGAVIAQDQDDNGNPVIMVSNLPSEEVINILTFNGVKFN